MRAKILIFTLAIAATLYAQDTVLNRSVVVERDFQPIIQDAGKVNSAPTAIQTDVPDAQVQYSDYVSTASQGPLEVSSLLSQPTRFTKPDELHGWLRGAIGHPLTLFNFSYDVQDNKNNSLKLYVNHDGQWGRRTMSETNLGFRFAHKMNKMTFYCGVKGENMFYTKYGRYYDNTSGYNRNRGLTIGSFADFQPEDKQTQWRGRIFFGLQANSTEAVQYKAEVGYQMLDVPGIAAEHQIRTEFDMNARLPNERHRLGINFYMQNNFYTVDTALIPENKYNNRHNLRMEPFYAYHGKRFMIHAGINLDLNIGKGQMLSSNENISFAPSPNVRFEAQLAPKWVTLYGKVGGRFGLGSLQSFLESNCYMEVVPCVTSHSVSSYVPVDAEIGFHLKPHKHLLLEAHGGYTYFLNSKSYVAFIDEYEYSPGHKILPGTFSDFRSDYQRFKIGGQVFYHYRDIISIHLSGDYFAWKIQKLVNSAKLEDISKNIELTPGRVYDRPDWAIALRIDGRIDEHWTLYSDNHFEGSRWAITTKGEYKLPAYIDMDLGAQYEFTKLNLAVFVQLNNIICRRNHTLYGYQSYLINGIAGVSWKF